LFYILGLHFLVNENSLQYDLVSNKKDEANLENQKGWGKRPTLFDI